MSKQLSALLILLLCPAFLQAELQLPQFFSDHMVLQQKRDVAIWGTADPGARVTVSFHKHSSTTKADRSGKWRISIPSGKANSEGMPLTIQSGDEIHSIKDVLVGEVWFASGQSNMVFSMNRVPAYEQVIAESDYPQIRMFNAPNVTAVDPQDNIAGEWTLCTPENIPNYSAVAFFFARKLNQELNVPIGIIKSAWGGKPVETFTSREALNTLPGTKALVDAAIKADEEFDLEKETELYNQRMTDWQAAVKAWKEKPEEERGRLPRKPTAPKRALDTEGKPGVLFNSMINPFVGYTIQGAIWYQGEGNAKLGAVPYDQTLPLLIEDWRSRWDDDFSFYFVQLANFRAPSTEPGNNDPWPLLQDRMRLVLETTPKTGMAIINDVGEANDIHPKNKHDVGERLALWALAKDYHQKIVYSGPLYLSDVPRGNQVTVKFDHVGTGLKTRDGGELARFEIAGQDQIWHWATARITGKDTVSVSCPEVAQPVAVRYAWASNPEGANLVNSEGLPASVFRTDNWDDVESQADLAALKLQEERGKLAAEIKEIAAQRSQAEPGSEEFNVLTARQRELMARFRAMVNPKP